MVSARDTDNIPQIPGIEVHPVQAAEQARTAAAAAQNATTAAEQAPASPPESVKDMSQVTREVLDKICALLEDARRLTPSDASKPHRAEAPASPATQQASKPSLASASNGETQPQPAAGPPATCEPETSTSLGKDEAD